MLPKGKSKLSAPVFKSPADVAAAVGVKPNLLFYYAFILKSPTKYRTFEITSKNGRKREIQTPIPPLKKIQRTLLEVLAPAYAPRPHVHGYVSRRSPITNADVHKYQRWVFHVDLRDFFTSITFHRVRGLFEAFPFKYDRQIARLLARLCCASSVLPQGAPTSPLIANLVCRSLDGKLALLARENRCIYSRYCDDLTFSTGRQIFPSALATSAEGGIVIVGDGLSEIIESEGFRIRRDKTNLRYRTDHQMVTGLTVNQFANVPRKYVRSIRNLLYIWRTHGKAAAEVSFDKLWQRNRPIGKTNPTLEEIVRGKVQYVGSVKGWFDPVYRRLATNLQAVDTEFQPTMKPSNRPKTVIIVHCEGKTDVKHIQAAWNEYKSGYPQLELRITHATNDTELLKRLESLSSLNQDTPSVGVFDSDNKYIVKQAKGGADGFRRWSRGIYSFVLPIPSHREDDEPLCVELLHTDGTLSLVDSHGRRIYRASEFKENKFHLDGHAVMTTGASSLIVGEVRSVATQENIALSKNSFAEMVLGKKAPFHDIELSGFEPIFQTLVKIRERWLQDRLEAF